MRVAFFHPDLGLGGAERLIVDAAASLARRGHAVTVYTSHYDPSRSFQETREGLFAVEVVGAWIPRTLGGGLHILCAVLRALWLATWVCLGSGASFDVVVSDQVSAYLVPLRLLQPRWGRFFYCHFPDLLLASRASLLQRVYRAPFDVFEALAMNMADAVVVNSHFTQEVFTRTFELYRGTRPSVLYPCVDVGADSAVSAPAPPGAGSRASAHVLLSINRFERKKALGRAIAGLEALRDAKPALFDSVRLILAGGWDARVEENVAYHRELVATCAEASLSSFDAPSAQAALESSAKVCFVRSFSDADKAALLRAATAVVYTPSHEHFGIVPIEAMAAARPVIAVQSGGPMESVSDATGILVPEPPSPADMATAFQTLLADPSRPRAMGLAGRQRAKDLFSRDAFAARLDLLLSQLHASPPASAAPAPLLFLAWVLVLLLLPPLAPLYALARPPPSILPPARARSP
jgi:alpha-1,3/alpha-1,6-mannosyltransferase